MTTMTAMKIAVCIKHVPCGQGRLDPATFRMERDCPGELNSMDKNAVEEALKIKDAGDAEVVVVTMGPEAAVETLRSALALGADRAVLVADAAAEGSDLVATARVLAAALVREQADLVLFGQQADDGGGAMLWAAIGDVMNLPVVSQVNELVVDGSAVRATRQTEVGDEVIEAPLPALVSVTDAINEPRYSSLKGRMGAKKKPLDQLALTDLGLDPGAAGVAGSRTVVLAVGEPPPRLNSRTIVDEDGSAAAAILDYLREKELA